MSKRSCGGTVIESQQASQTFAGPNFTGGFSDPVRWHREEDYITLCLMVAFGRENEKRNWRGRGEEMLRQTG